MFLGPEYRDMTPEELGNVCSKQCKAKCCRAPMIMSLTEKETATLRTLARSLKVDVVINQVPGERRYTLEQRDQTDEKCPFLTKDNLCAIHDQRPNSCLTWPGFEKQQNCLLSGWKPSPKIFVGTVHGKTTPTDFLGNYAAVIISLMSSGMLAGFAMSDTVRVDSNRNKCVDEFLKSDADYLLFMDDDMYFPRDIGQLLLRHGKDITCGLYFQRKADDPYPHMYEYAGWGKGDYDQEGQTFRPMTKEVYGKLKDMPLVDKPCAFFKDDLLVEVDAGATGCILIHRRVFETMPSPWFRTDGATNGDMQFFYKAKQVHGFEIWADLGIIATHARTAEVGLKTFVENYQRFEPDQNAPSINSAEYWDKVHGSELMTVRVNPGVDAALVHLIKGFSPDESGFDFCDFGCGRSSIVYSVGTEFPNVRFTGIDQSKAAIEDNRRKYPQFNWLVSDTGNVGMVDSSFDLVFSNSLIEHLDDPIKTTDEMWRLLRPGGFMVQSIPLNFPHKEHAMVYDWDSVVKLVARYGGAFYVVNLHDRAIVAVQKEA